MVTLVFTRILMKNSERLLKKELNYQGERSVFLFDNHPQRLHLFDNDRYPSMDLDNIDFVHCIKLKLPFTISNTDSI